MSLYYPRPENAVIFRPKSSDGSKDYYIDRSVANQMQRACIIAGDSTNGGFMPYPGKLFDEHRFKAEYEMKPPIPKTKGK